MSETPVVIGLVLLAVLVGALIPVLYHAVQTLKSIKQFVDSAGPRVERAVVELTETAARLNRIGATVESEGERLRPLMDSAAGVGQTLVNLRKSLSSAGTLMSAVGPAILAGLGAFVARRRSGRDEDEGGTGGDESGEDEGQEGIPGRSASEPERRTEDARHGH